MGGPGSIGKKLPRMPTIIKTKPNISSVISMPYFLSNEVTLKLVQIPNAIKRSCTN